MPSGAFHSLVNAISHAFTFISTPSLVLDSFLSSVIGGGTAFLIREPCNLLSSPTAIFKSFEMSSVTMKLPHSKLTLYNIYRPPPSAAKSRLSVSFSQFLNDFQTLISSVSTTPHYLSLPVTSTFILMM